MVYAAPIRCYKRADRIFLQHFYGQNRKAGGRVRTVSHVLRQKIIGMNMQTFPDPQNVIGGQGQMLVSAAGVETGKLTVTGKMKAVVRF